MRYLKVRWQHDDPGEPVLLLSELSDASWEIRKIEYYADQSIGRAEAGDTSTGSTRLGLVPVPSIEQINQSPEFAAVEITPSEFALAWRSACSFPEPKVVSQA